MILSDISIQEIGIDIIKPFNYHNIQPASYDLTLADEFYVIDEKQGMIDLSSDKEVKYKNTKKFIEEYNIIAPNEFLLATTVEKIFLPDNMAAFVQNRSSIGRIGLKIENAGWVDAGFKGQITLELKNESPIPIKLNPGMRICQLIIAELDLPAGEPYRGKYQNQKGVTGSKINLDI